MYENIKQEAELIWQRVKEILSRKEQLILAIDGRCGAGKTTLASYLQTVCDCNVIPMDHFFLRPEQRTKERLMQPGGNVDYERFLKEVLEPFKEGEAFSYRPYDCQKQKLLGERYIVPGKITIVEGSYSCHPKLRAFYDITIFMTVDEREQCCRIEKRNGKEALSVFKDKWIPLEETYFSACDIPEKCDFCFDTGQSLGTPRGTI